MGNLLEYSGIVTKIRAMKAKLLTPKQFEEIASLGFRGEDVQMDYEVGDMVVVISGAWKDTVGAIKSINETKKTITINVEMFGRETPVELNFTEVKKM